MDINLRPQFSFAVTRILGPVTDEKPDLRTASFTPPGAFAEDEESLVTEKKVSDLEKIGDRDRQVAALVAASHRKGRTREEKLDSARKASGRDSKNISCTFVIPYLFRKYNSYSV